MKQRFLVVHDYGMGGIWGYVFAPSPTAITDRYPEVQVVEREPAWVSDEDRDRWERSAEDIDEPKRLGLLGIILRGRIPLERPTVTDRLLEWHRETRGVEWGEDEGAEMRLLDAGRVRTRISLVGTKLEGTAFEPVKVNRSDDDWFYARLEGDAWVADYGPLNDDEAHSLFLDWAAKAAAEA